MKKIGILNSDISEVVASMGHGDMLTICDAGLPIPTTNRRIDLALRKGLPAFLDTVITVTSELHVEKIVIATEMLESSPEIRKAVLGIFSNAVVQEIPHNEFKQLASNSKAYIRTGECTPYANVILVSGVWGFEGEGQAGKKEVTSV